MKILLAYPPCLDPRFSSGDALVTPLGLYYIGALLLDNGYDVEIVSFAEIESGNDPIRKILCEKKPDILGLSIFNANRWGGIETASIAKELNAEIKIVFGGVGATFLWKHFLTHFNVIDYLVIGEGEYTFLNLVKYLEKGDTRPPYSIKGISFRDGERIHKTDPPEKIHDLDRLPLPAKYFNFQHLALMRGCPGKCAFCGSPEFWGSDSISSHSANYFVDQLEMLKKRGITFFYVADDTFTLNKTIVIEICREILKRELEITWTAISRVDCINEDILYWMRMAGCIQISFGIESGSEVIRKRLGKNIKNKKIKNAFRLCTNYGILPRVYFIYGSPGETWDSINQTIDLMLSIKPLALISYLLVVFPGTGLYHEYKKQKQVTDDIWLEKIEDIPWFEAEPQLSGDLIKKFGKKIRDAFHCNLAFFAGKIQLVERKELYEKHAGFLSRLGLTFSHGDYDSVENNHKIAEELFERALEYFPNHRAYLGLGMLFQKKRDFVKSIAILEKGILQYPSSEDLHMCIGLNWMNLGDFRKALEYLLKFQDSEKMSAYIEECYRALDKGEKELL